MDYWQVYYDKMYYDFIFVGATVVIILTHAIAMTPPIPTDISTGDEELGVIMEDITIS